LNQPTPLNCPASVNHCYKVEGYIGLKDLNVRAPPAHLPTEIENVFREGAACLGVGCFNASATMFRLCVDLASKSRMPPDGEDGMTPAIRKSLLGNRLNWLFEHRYIPEELKPLSICIKDDGNDGAHAGTLTEVDAADLCDFTIELLEKLYTNPARVQLAGKRREERHAPQAKSVK
jgi:hypothetical protein